MLATPRRELTHRTLSLLAPRLGTEMAERSKIPKLFRDNALTLAFAALFLASLAGQILTGHAVYCDEAREHGAPAISLTGYLRSGHFLEAVFENWESEFLQMGIFVVLTKYLKQKGSSESRKFEGDEETDEDPRKHRHDPDAPLPVRKGGALLTLYEHSLSLALAALFVASFALHAVGGARAHAEEERRHGRPPEAISDYVTGPQFWFESFQNWQSEFLSVGALVVLSIFLRERGSPQSKRVAAPHAETGG